jgi:hypothetical protein
MNHPSAARVVCPACGGARYRQAHYSDHRELCFSCRGQGTVEADRVCPVCHRFIDFCSCPPRRGFEVIMRTGSGYFYVESEHAYRVEFTRSGHHWHIATVHNEDEAARIALECKEATDEELVAIREKYRKHHRRNGQQHLPIAGAPVQTFGAEQVEAAAQENDDPPDDGLPQLLQAALTIEAKMKQAWGDYEMLKAQTHAAWQAFGQALEKARHGGIE